MKINFLIKGIAISAVALMSTSCQHEPIEPYNPPQDEGGNCDPDSVYFNRDIFPIIQTNCAVSGCHGGGSAEGGVDLTTYASIMATADVDPFDPDGSDLYEVITDTDPADRMPLAPADPLSADEIATIEKWINQGAPNNSCDVCDTNTFTFSGAVSVIIENNCSGCHSGASPSAGISLTTYDEISAYATSGVLMAVINHEDGYTPMPYGLPKMDDCVITQVRKWVENGASND